MRGKPRLVVVSGLIWGGKPGQLISLAEVGELRLYTSRWLLAEVEATLNKPKLAKPIAAAGHSSTVMVADYRRLCTLVHPQAQPEPLSRDFDDDHVIACAIAASAHAIVTGDDDLLVLGTARGIQMLSPGTAISHLA
jgi:putative PIN family toxin of toxin-antitoxin system